jgi:hypothetical protein
VQFGPALGGPDADPDGDGRLNRTEMLERTHPTATWTAGFAEGFGPMFRTSLDVWNPSASEMARAWLRSERGGVVVDARLVLVPPRSCAASNTAPVVPRPSSRSSSSRTCRS